MNKARSSLRQEWARPAKSLTTSLLDIDIAMMDVVSHRHSVNLEGFGGRGPTSILEHAIEGIVRNDATAEGGTAEPYIVYINGYEDRDRLDRDDEFDQRSVCYISNDRRPDYAWSTNIYVENFIFRRLVELFSTRRIDSAKISILLKVLRDATGAIDLPILMNPALRGDDDRHRQHSRAHLMSVLTSLGGHGVQSTGSLLQGPDWRNRIARGSVAR